MVLLETAPVEPDVFAHEFNGPVALPDAKAFNAFMLACYPRHGYIVAFSGCDPRFLTSGTIYVGRAYIVDDDVIFMWEFLKGVFVSKQAMLI